jgi:stress response protein YsnF
MKTIIAAFADRASADRASAQIERVRGTTISAGESRPEDLIRDLRARGVPHQQVELYAEAVRRGATLLIVQTDDEHAEELALELDRAGSLDLEATGARWRTTGWAGYDASALPYTETEAATEREQLLREGLPVVEEQVTVGKREVPREGVRVRTFVVERPVHETIELRDERINVTREPADEPLPAGAADSTFTEQQYEVTATGEEAVVGKQARVVERVRVDKEASTRTETIEDTERRREVEVEPAAPTPTPPGSRP